jgi:hypothetical protein
MDETPRDDTPGVGRTDETVVAVRGLGVALTAQSLRALLDPTTRDEAEIVVDLSRLSIDLPAAALGAIVARIAPDLGVELDQDAATVHPAGAPAIRCLAPAEGVRVRIGAAGLTVGNPSEP